ncbi:MAG TPA: SGNH/GDSL hydrolase family protein [Saprospiraceae bacterium]|nr:SGNH/GDSL hydrolase family protein [Saprospiraceae bacterium]HMQ85586.1 SGNH/GDSL hydrolase family protein [Saprospiraceae bacterium]
MKQLFFIVLLCFVTPLFSQAQDALQFKAEVDALLAKWPPAENQGRILFTGSSSVRLWPDLQASFPETPVLNLGFGGSQFSDLLYYLEELVVAYQPKQVFIYEGDNDLAAEETPKAIQKEARTLVKYLKKRLPDTPIVFISTKPSPSRWHLSAAYLELNEKLARLAKRKSHIDFADVWSPMMLDADTVRPDLFLEDRLHMNAEGYEIWTKVIGDKLLR